MATKKTSTEVNEDKIMALYMDYVLENEAEPKSIYRFSKECEIEEEGFYRFFGSIEGLKAAIWNKFFDNTFDLLQKNKAYSGYGNRDKMLTFFFTFFELLGKNRSYVLFALQENGNKLEGQPQLRGLRKRVRAFATELIDEANAGKNLKITKQSPMLFSEGAWLQLLFLLRFWIKDGSAGFEQTDLAIEKSVRTIFDVFDNSVLDGLVDFGKFIYKSGLA